MIALYTLILSLFVTTALVPLLSRYAYALKMLDLPNERKIHQRAIPRIGGVAIVFGAFAVAWLHQPRADVIAYFLSCFIIFLFGVIDDRSNLNYRIKFFGQIVAALLFIFVSGVWLSRVPFMYAGAMPAALGIPLTVLLIVGITNAINMSDGLDGLAGGTSLLGAGALGYLAYTGADKQVALIALGLIGAILGFLRYNTYPARIFMGDSGSQFLGFSVATLGVLLIERSNTAISPLVPLLILGLPITDTLMVMTQRIRSGRSPFLPDRQHLHHRLLDTGLNQHESVAIIYGVQFLLILSAWLLQYKPDGVVLGVFCVLMTALWLSVHAWQTPSPRQQACLHRLKMINRLTDYVLTKDLLRLSSTLMLTYGLMFGLPLAALSVQGITPDVSWLALLLCLILLLALLIKPLPLHALNRLAAFVAAVCVVYLGEVQGFAWGLNVAWLRAWLIFIAVSVALKLRFDRSEFRINTLDLLMVLIIAIVPNMPFVRALKLGAPVIETVVLFYAFELALSRPTPRWHALRFSVLISLSILALRGF